ncbi:MAG: hypothetical protein AB1938_17325 [Myxococcota bacterium]
MRMKSAILLMAMGALSACGGASSMSDGGADAGVSFDGGPGTLWVHLWSDVVVGIDTRDGHEVKRFTGVGASQGGDGILALGAGKLWFQGDNGIRSLDLATGAGSDLPGASGGKYPAYGAGAVWWAEEGTLADPGPIYRYDTASQTTTHTNTGGLPNGTGGLIAAGPDGCWSLYSRMLGQEKGVAHVRADGTSSANVVLMGETGLGASVATGGGRGYALTHFVATGAKRLFAIDASTDSVVTQRDITTPEFGANDLLANEDHLLFAEGTVWFVDVYGEKFYELDPATLATRRSVPTGGQSTKQSAIGAGGAWSGYTRELRRTDLATGAVVTLPMPENVRAMVFQAP